MLGLCSRWRTNLIVEQAESALLAWLGYDWVDTCVTKYFSKYKWSSMIGSFAASESMLKKDIEVVIISLEQCNVIDNVCYGQDGLRTDFFLCTCTSSKIFTLVFLSTNSLRVSFGS